MQEHKHDLKSLTNTLMDEVSAYGILKVSLGQYQTVCNKINVFAASSGQESYSQVLMEKFRKNLDTQVEKGCLCPEYCRFQKRDVSNISQSISKPMGIPVCSITIQC